MGIYWMLQDISDFFYADPESLENGQKYGDWIISQYDHATLWDELGKTKKLITLPRYYRSEYYLLPRGRVSYRPNEGKYYVYYGDWFKKQHKAMFFEKYQLTADNTIFEQDIHYSIKRQVLLYP